MSEYRRFVSYIYEYDRGRKSRNTGFAKVESRNGLCKLNIQLQNVPESEGELKVYAFVRVGEWLKGILIGEVRAKMPTTEIRITTPADKVGSENYSLGGLAGLWISSAAGATFLSVWDEDPIEVKRLVTKIPGERENSENTPIPQERTAESSSTLQSENENRQTNGLSNITNTKAAGLERHITETENEQETASMVSEGSQQEITSRTRVNAGNQQDTASTVREENQQPTASRVNESGQQPTASRVNESGQQPKASRVNESGQQPTASRVNESGQQPTASRVNESGQRTTAPQVNESSQQETIARISTGSQQEPATAQREAGPRQERAAIRATECQQMAPGTKQENYADIDIMAAQNQAVSNQAGSQKQDQVVGSNVEGGNTSNIEEVKAFANANGSMPKNNRGEALSRSGQEANPRMSKSEMDQRWQFLSSRYQHMQPFEDEDISDGIRIAPRDLGILRQNNWRLGKNSFLMHGYYNYRHLLFVKLKGGSYILCVPGIFDNQERHMATTFGFPNFRKAKEQNGKYVFGYWCRTLE